MKKRLYFFILFLVVTLSVLAVYIMQRKADAKVKVAVRKLPPPPPNPHLQKAIDDFESQLDLLLLTSKTPGAAVAIVHDSTVVYMRGFGVKEEGKPDSVDVHTVFRLASVSKCFASFLTGTLVEERKLSWDDKISSFLPGFSLYSPEETMKLSVRHVLSHSTGLPFHAYTNLVEEGLPLENLLARLKDVPLASRVGEAYSYQNVAYSLVGEAIRGATGKSYEACMAEKVFGPLNMKDASLDYFSMITNPNVAKPHMPRRGGVRKVSINNTYYNVSPAGGINASISDMAQWMIALLGNRPEVIRPETLRSMFAPAVKAPSKNRNYGRMHRVSDSYYGLGWRILHYPDDTLFYHGGFVSGYRSEVAVNPNDRIAICILSNAPGELPDNGIPVFFNIIKQYREDIRRWDLAQRKNVADSLSL